MAHSTTYCRPKINSFDCLAATIMPWRNAINKRINGQQPPSRCAAVSFSFLLVSCGSESFIESITWTMNRVLAEIRFGEKTNKIDWKSSSRVSVCYRFCYIFYVVSAESRTPNRFCSSSDLDSIGGELALHECAYVSHSVDTSIDVITIYLLSYENSFIHVMCCRSRLNNKHPCTLRRGTRHSTHTRARATLHNHLPHAVDAMPQYEFIAINKNDWASLCL